MGLKIKSQNLYNKNETAVTNLNDLQAITKPTASKANVWTATTVDDIITFATAAKGIAIPCSYGDTFSWKEQGTITTSRRRYVEVDSEGKVLVAATGYTTAGLSHVVANENCAYLLIEWATDATDESKMVVVKGSTIPTEYQSYMEEVRELYKKNPEYVVPQDTYTQLSYIENSGLQYLDTGIIGANGVKIRTKIKVADANAFNPIIASRINTSDNRFYICTFENQFDLAILTDNLGGTVVEDTWYELYVNTTSSGGTLSIDDVSLITSSSTIDTACNMYMFAVNRSGIVTSIASNLYISYLTIYDSNNILIRNFIPAKRNSDNSIGMYDTVSGTFFENAGDGDFIAGEEIPKTIYLEELYKKNPEYVVPQDTYTQLNYIESSGEQYLDSGVTLGTTYLNTDMKLEFDAEVNSGSHWQVIGGSLGSAGLFIGVNGSNYIAYACGSDIVTSIINPYVRCKWVNDAKNGTATVTRVDTGVTLLDATYTPIAKTTAVNLALFSFFKADNTISPYKTSGKIYSAKIYNNDVLIRNFIPAKRNSDSVIGMFDTVSGTFFTNAGTGDFIAGEEIPKTFIVFDSGWDTTVTANPASLPNARSGKKLTYKIQGANKRYITVDGADYECPDGYKLFNYIQATGTQSSGSAVYYINTGIAGSLDTEIETDVTHIFDSSSSIALITPFASNKSSTGGIVLTHYSSGPAWATKFGDKAFSKKGAITSGTKYHIVMNKDTFTVNGTSESIGATSLTDTSNIYLICDIWSTAIYTTTALRMGTTIIRQGGITVFKGVPAKRDSDNSIGMFDFVSNTFFTNSGTGVFGEGSELPYGSDNPLGIKFSEGEVITETDEGEFPLSVEPKLDRDFTQIDLDGNVKRTIDIDGVTYEIPSAVTLLDYIGSNSQAYIDTGYKPTSDTAVECTYYPLSNSVFMNIFGCRDNISGPSYYALISATQYRVQVNTSGNSGTSMYYGINVNGTLAEGTNGTFAQNQQKVTLTLDSYNKLVKVESDEYTGTTDASSMNFGDSDCSYNLYLFTRPVAGEITSANNFNGYVYSFKMWERGTLVRAFIPAKRNSDNEIGMYDLVSNTFFTNAGSGSFTAGNEAPCPDCNLGVKGVGDKTANLLNYKEIYGTNGYRNSTAETQCQCYDISVPNGTYTISTTCPYGSGTICSVFAMKGHFASSFSSAVHGVSNEKTLTVTVTDGILSVGIRATKSSSASYPVYPTLAEWEATGYTIMVNEGSTVLSHEPFGYKFPILHSQNTGCVDLGTLTWKVGKAATGYFYTSTAYADLKATSTGDAAIMYCSRYNAIVNTIHDKWAGTTQVADMSIGQRSSNVICIKDSNYANCSAADFKAAMSGVYLYYQRSTDENWNPPNIYTAYASDPLRKVGTYTDTLKAIEGKVSRVVGKVEFDGTEDWSYESTYTRFVTPVPDCIIASTPRTLPGLCSHYKIISDSRPISKIISGDAYFGTSATYPSNESLYIHDYDYSDVTTWKSYLAAQYEAGSPITLYYPLATPTEETITPISVTGVKGVNYIDVNTTLKPSDGAITLEEYHKYKLIHGNNCNCVDMGSLNWDYLNSRFHTTITDKSTENGTLYTSAYPTTTIWSAADKVMYSASTAVYIMDTDFGTDVDAFKAAMSGIYLFYKRTSDSSWSNPVAYDIYDDESLKAVDTYEDTISTGEGETNIVKFEIGSLNFGSSPLGSYSIYDQVEAFSPLIKSDDGTTTAPILCDIYAPALHSSVVASTCPNYSICVKPDGNGIMVFNTDYDDDTLYPTGADKVAAFKAAMTGKYFYGVMRTPVTKTVSTAPSLPTVKGDNTLVVEGGDVATGLECVYRKRNI